jgi:hypothetical protein
MITCGTNARAHSDALMGLYTSIKFYAFELVDVQAVAYILWAWGWPLSYSHSIVLGGFELMS